MLSSVRTRLHQCRFCRKVDNQSVVNEIEKCLDLVRDLTQIELTISPNLPHLICNDCVERLLDANLMREICIESERRLLNLAFNDDEDSEVEDILEPGEVGATLVAPVSPEQGPKPLELVLTKSDIDLRSLTIKPSVDQSTSLNRKTKSSVRVIIREVHDGGEVVETKPSPQRDPIQVEGESTLSSAEVRQRVPPACDGSNGSFTMGLNRSESSTKPTICHTDSDLNKGTQISPEIESTHPRTPCDTKPERKPRKAKTTPDIITQRAPKFGCCQCKFSSMDRLETIKHFNDNHKAAKQTTKKVSSRQLHHCNLCHKSFNNRVEVYQHKRAPRKKLLNCPECNELMPTVSQLRRHKLDKHGITENFPCKQCDRVFNFPSSLANHVVYEHRGSLHVCEECGATFKHGQSLRDHLRLHSRNFPYQCDVCDQRFIRKGSLTSHLRSHSGAKPYSCDYCSRTFSFAVDKKRHLPVHTGVYPYNCLKCKRGFTRKKVLTEHMLTHQ